MYIEWDCSYDNRCIDSVSEIGHMQNDDSGVECCCKLQQIENDNVTDNEYVTV